MNKVIFFLLFFLINSIAIAQTSQQCYENALKLIEQNGSSTKINDLLYKSVKLDTTNSKAYFLIGKRHYESNMKGFILKHLRKANRLDSSNLEYKWLLSEVILKKNIKSPELTLDGVFEGVKVLDEMTELGAKSVKIYKRKAIANSAVFKHYHYQYKTFTPKKSESWEDEKPDFTEKENYKKVSLVAYNKLIESCNEILKLDSDNSFAKKYLKNLENPFLNQE